MSASEIVLHRHFHSVVASYHPFAEYEYSPQKRYIATNREVGRVVNLGSFPVGRDRTS